LVQSETVVGEICHILASSPDGPRYDEHQNPKERHGYDNLILLCPIHHEIVDDDPEAYTKERLRKMKIDHEASTGDIDAQDVEHGSRLLTN
jgi:hypothetical protein